jgi:hypothetical protein
VLPNPRLVGMTVDRVIFNARVMETGTQSHRSPPARPLSGASKQPRLRIQRWQDNNVAAPPILRAIPEAGQRWDDLSEDLLFILLQDIEAGGGSFLIVERTTDPSGHTYAQALRRDDGSYVVEYREGDADHYGIVVAGMRAAHQLLTGWAFQLPGWPAPARSNEWELCLLRPRRRQPPN